MIRVATVACLKDNYAYLVIAGRDAVVVDPSEAQPVRDAVEREGVVLRAIWSTHHHWDHVGGNEALATECQADVLGYEGDRDRIPAITRGVGDGEELSFGGAKVSCIHVPGHTLGAVAYVVDWGVERAVFTGDTLFSGGCGRLFEGTGAQMAASLARLAALEGDTRVYCGHEYTQNNLRFAAHAEPSNADVAAAQETAAAQRGRGQPTVGTTLSHERRVNPFFRLASPELRARMGIAPGASDEAAFVALRSAKDRF